MALKRWHVVYTHPTHPRWVYCKDCADKGNGQHVQLPYAEARAHVDANHICDKCGALLRYSIVEEDAEEHIERIAADHADAYAAYYG